MFPKFKNNAPFEDPAYAGCRVHFALYTSSPRIDKRAFVELDPTDIILCYGSAEADDR